MRTLLLLAGYVLVGGYVGARIYEWVKKDSFNSEAEARGGAVFAFLFWPLVVVTLFLWYLVHWFIQRRASKRERKVS